MRSLAAEHGLDALVAPVRPTKKAAYPLTPMERYVEWRRPTGEAFDPWIRVHERLGGQIVGVASESFTVTASVAEWERWTGLAFPDSGDYVIDGALVPVVIDRGADIGRYVEPNVWIHHTPLPAATS
jgi:hypothetical protein